MKAWVGLAVLYSKSTSNPCGGDFTQKHNTKAAAKLFCSTRRPSCQLSIERTPGQGIGTKRVICQALTKNYLSLFCKATGKNNQIFLLSSTPTQFLPRTQQICKQRRSWEVAGSVFKPSSIRIHNTESLPTALLLLIL